MIDEACINNGPRPAVLEMLWGFGKSLLRAPFRSLVVVTSLLAVSPEQEEKLLFDRLGPL